MGSHTGRIACEEHAACGRASRFPAKRPVRVVRLAPQLPFSPSRLPLNSGLVAVDFRCGRGTALEIGDQRLHLGDFEPLRLDDLVSQLANPRIGDLGPFACQDGDRMMRDHRLHIVDIIDRDLAAKQIKQSCEDQNCAQKY